MSSSLSWGLQGATCCPAVGLVQGLTWFPAGRPDLRDMLCRWVPAFSRALMCHVRKGSNVEKELQVGG